MLFYTVAALVQTDLVNQYYTQIKPFYESGTFGTFQGKDKVPIAYRLADTMHPTAIVIAPGKSLQMQLYSEFIFDLKDQPVSVYVLDHRGQGNSGRITKNPNVTHVKEFQDYVDDFAFFLDVFVLPKHKSVIGFGESMGGLITSAYSVQRPGVLSAMVLSSPMMGINTDPYPQVIACSISNGAVLLGQGQNYAIGQKTFQNATIEKSVSSQSPERIEVFNIINTENAKGAGGGVSFNWIAKSIKYSEEFVEKKALNVPVLMFTGGKDTVVDVPAEKKACNKAVKCTQQFVQDSKHLFTMEKDEIRQPFMDQMLAFIQPYIV
ncbi:Alpha/Beta hydrolase protein [Gorgonomyces haynaldii]|nr:Alpha/Beta hydrolase protein [Gorgonomyces haynaldii]